MPYEGEQIATPRIRLIPRQHGHSGGPALHVRRCRQDPSGSAEGKSSLACPSCCLVELHEHVATLPSCGQVLPVNVLANVGLALSYGSGQFCDGQVHGFLPALHSLSRYTVIYSCQDLHLCRCRSSSKRTRLPGQARQRARSIIERAARGEDPEKARDAVLAVPTLEQVFEVYMAAGENRAPRTVQTYRYEIKRYLGDWLSRPLDSIDAEDVRDRFERITDNHGWSAANRVISLLAFALPETLRRHRDPAQPSQSLARRGRPFPFQASAPNLHAGRCAPALAGRYRG